MRVFGSRQICDMDLAGCAPLVCGLLCYGLDSLFSIRRVVLFHRPIWLFSFKIVRSCATTPLTRCLSSPLELISGCPSAHIPPSYWLRDTSDILCLKLNEKSLMLESVRMSFRFSNH